MQATQVNLPGHSRVEKRWETPFLEKQTEDTQSRVQGFFHHPNVSPLRQDWSQYLNTLPSEGDILVNPHDGSPCKYQITFFMCHLAKMSFREKLSHIISMFNSFMDSIKVVFNFPLKSRIPISVLLQVKP